jgi:single-stranded-DNA-specific exonuclease
MEAAGPFGVGWPAPRIVTGPLRIVKADRVGSGGHVRLLLSGQDGASLKAVAFRQADSPLGQSLLGGSGGRTIWVAGRVKIDEWGGGRSAELHIEDAAWAD